MEHGGNSRTLCVGLCAALSLGTGSQPEATPQQTGSVEAASSVDSMAAIAWPRWRGPMGTGEADATPPVTWSEEENVAWKVALPGHGKSTPIVLGERIFLQAAIRAGEAPAEAIRARAA